MANNHTKVYSVRDNLNINPNTMHKETAKKLFFRTQYLLRQGKTKSEIAGILHLARKTIIEWAKKESYQDNRGWPEGKYRVHTNEEEEKVLEIRDRIVDKEMRYFWGKDIILKEYQKLYPNDPSPSLWFIEEVIRNHERQIFEPKKRRKDISRYLHYPYNLIGALGKVQESVDFIGRKYIDGVTEPLHFLARYYLKPAGLYLVSRTNNEKREEIEQVLSQDWQKIPSPDVAILDNANSMYGPAKAKHFIGLFIQKLLQYRVTPIFNPPRSPWANGGVEGSNSIFGRKFWNSQRFENAEQIDQELNQFNRENVERANLDYLSQKSQQDKFREEVYFVRFAKVDSSWEKYPSIEVLNDKVYLPETYTNQYTFAKLDVGKDYLTVFVEREAKPQTISKQKFPLRFTKSKLTKLISIPSFSYMSISQSVPIFD